MEHLVFDRALLDVQRWKTLHAKGWAGMNDAERAEWLGFMKGRYTAEDMNRVEAAVETISARLTEIGYRHLGLTVKTDWTSGDCPTAADFDRYFANVETLRSAIPTPPSTPKTPTTAVRFNHQAANDVERILFDVDRSAGAVTKSWHYAGEIFTGEV